MPRRLSMPLTGSLTLNVKWQAIQSGIHHRFGQPNNRLRKEAVVQAFADQLGHLKQIGKDQMGGITMVNLVFPLISMKNEPINPVTSLTDV